MDRKNLTPELFFNLFKQKGYALNDFNIIGIRYNDNLDKFSDLRIILRKANGQWDVHIWNQTTKPAISALAHPDNPEGCAIIKEGQYLNAWEIGLHKGHEALIQCKAIEVYRDTKHDGSLDYHTCKVMSAGPECGLNHHSIWWGGHPEWDGTYPTVSFGGKWSEGCQVGERPSEHHAFMDLCKLSGLKFFSYTLFNITELQN